MPDPDTAVLDAPTNVDSEESSFGESAVESLDEITKPDGETTTKPEDAPGTTTPAEPAKPEDAPPVKPEEKPAEEPVAPTTEQITERATALDQREQQLNEVYTDVQNVLNDPKFQQAYQQANPQQRGEPGSQVDDQGRPLAPAEGANDPLEGFEAETVGQERIVEAMREQSKRIDQQMADTTAQFKQQIESLTAKLGNYENSYNAGQDEQTDKEEAAAVEGLKTDFPDLIDGGEKQKALSAKAANLLLASIPDENSPPDAKPLTIAEAFSDAAAILGKDGIADRARKQVEAEATAASAASAESPGGTGSEGPNTFRELAEANYAG